MLQMSLHGGGDLNPSQTPVELVDLNLPVPSRALPHQTVVEGAQEVLPFPFSAATLTDVLA